MSKPNYEKSAAEKNYEEQQKKGYAPSQLVKGTDPGAPSENGFVSVDPVYQNFANETEKPLAADGGVESKLETHYDDDTDFDAAATPEGESEESEEDETESSPAQSSPSGPSVPNTPSS